MSGIVRRVIAALFRTGRTEEAKALYTTMRARKPRGPKYRPAVQVPGGYVTIGTHDMLVGLVLRYRRFYHCVHYAPPARARDSNVYLYELSKMGLRK